MDSSDPGKQSPVHHKDVKRRLDSKGREDYVPSLEDEEKRGHRFWAPGKFFYYVDS